MTQRLRRSVLFMPADDASGIREAAATGADSIVYELEDMVAEKDKQRARENLEQEIPALNLKDTEVCVRINSLKSDYWLADLETAVDIDADTVVLPKTDYPREIETVSDVLAQCSSDTVEIIIMLESPQAFFNIDEIGATCRERPDITGCFYGEGDYCEHINATHANDDVRKFLNNFIVGLAGMGDMDAIAAADLNVDDEDAQRAYTEHCRDLGFVGQQALYPHQVDQINAVFTPSEEEYEQAKSLIHRFEENDEGNVVIDGTVLDRPLVNRYRQIIAKYNAVHDIEEELNFHFIEYE